MESARSYLSDSVVTCVRSPHGSIALEVSNINAPGILMIEIIERESKKLRVSLRRTRRKAVAVVTGQLLGLVIDTYDTLFTKKEVGCRLLERGLCRFFDDITSAIAHAPA